MEEEENLLLDAARERVPDGALEERDEVGIAAHDVREERTPSRAVRRRIEGDGRQLRQLVRARMRSKGPGAQIERPVRTIEQPWIRVELIGDDGELRHRARDGEHRADRVRAVARHSMRAKRLLSLLVRMAGRFGGDRARGLERAESHGRTNVGPPGRRVPYEPLPPSMVVENVRSMMRREPLRVSSVR